MIDHPDTNEDDDHVAQLRRFLDEIRTRCENPPSPAELFPKVDYPDNILGAYDGEGEQFYEAEAYHAVFDPDPYKRETAMPQYVMRALLNAGAPLAVQKWMAFVFREAKIPHQAKGRPVQSFAKSDFWHDLAVFLIDHESVDDSGIVKLLEDASTALAASGHHAASYSKVRSAYYDTAFQELLNIYRRSRDYLRTVYIPTN